MNSKIRYILNIVYQFSLHTKKKDSLKSFLILCSICISLPLILHNIIHLFQESIKEKYQVFSHLEGVKNYPSFSNANSNIEEMLLQFKIEELKKHSHIKSIFFTSEKRIFGQYQNKPYLNGLLKMIDPIFYADHQEMLNFHFPLIVGLWNFEKSYQIILSQDFLNELLEFKLSDIHLFIEDIKQKNYPQIKILHINKDIFFRKKDSALDLDHSIENLNFHSLYFEVIGIFVPTHYSYKKILFANLEAYNFFHIPSDLDTINELSASKNIAIFLSKPFQNIELIQSRIQELFNPNFYFFYSWEEKNKNLLKAFEWEKDIFKILIGCISFFFIFILMYIHIYLWIFKKEKLIAILKFLGFSFQKIYYLLFIQELMLGILGILLANLMALMFLFSYPFWIEGIESFLAYYFNRHKLFYYKDISFTTFINYLNLKSFIYINLIAFIIMIFSILFSLKSALRKKIIEIIKIKNI